MAHKLHEEVEKEIEEAQKIVKVGGIYYHYKHPENLYKVVGFATQEATDKICVIYQSENEKKLIFVRDLDSWIEEPFVDGKKIKRFTEIS